MNELKNCDQEHNYLTYIFNHCVNTDDQKLNQDVRNEMAKCFTNATNSMAQFQKMQPAAMAEMKSEMDSSWEAIKHESQFNKLGGTQDGLRKQIIVDDAEEEADGSRQREAKDLVRMVAGSLPAQSTLANEAQSASALNSGEGTKDQTHHADAECDVNVPSDGLHSLWHNRHIISLQPCKFLSTFQAIHGSHNLMAAFPEDVGDIGTHWNLDDLCRRVGLPSAGYTLPHIKIPLGPGWYVLFLGHFIHGGGDCWDRGGSWRLHMYSEGKGTCDPVDPQATCLLGPTCCSVAGIPVTRYGISTQRDAQSITSGIVKRAQEALAARLKNKAQTEAPYAFF